MANVTLRYWAAAKEAAGVAEESLAADTLAAALSSALARDGRAQRLGPVLARCSFLIDGNPVGARAPEHVMLQDAAVIEVLPPFAGG
jgi:molybdopterin synthase sulfur carrier subunit